MRSPTIGLLLFSLLLSIVTGCLGSPDLSPESDDEEGHLGRSSDQNEPSLGGSENEGPPQKDAAESPDLEGEIENESLLWEKIAPRDSREWVTLTEVTAGNGTTCFINYQRSGLLDTEHVLLGYRTDLFTHHIAKSANLRGDHYVSVENYSSTPVFNTFYDIYYGIQEYPVPHHTTWHSGWGQTMAENGTIGLLFASFGINHDADEKTYVKVECDSDQAYIRFYEAEDFTTITSNSGHSDLGLNTYIPLLSVDGISYNQGSRFSIDTTTDLVVLDLMEAPFQSTALDVKAEATLRIDSPTNHTTIDYSIEDEWWFMQEVWTEPGRYQLEFDRYAENYFSLVGILAGFSVVDQAGRAEIGA